jgi:rubredoxin
MNNYHCRACGVQVKHDGRPTGHCDESGSGNHNWEDFGPVGDDAYKCKACGLLIYSDGRPKPVSNNHCDKSGSGNHQWEVF